MTNQNVDLSDLLDNGGEIPEVKPISIAELKEQSGEPEEITKAADLLGKKLILRSARPFQSRFSAQDTAYFVTGVIADTGELFASVFGGAAVVETLATWQRINPNAPLTASLKRIDGGRWGKYYILE